MSRWLTMVGRDMEPRAPLIADEPRRNLTLIRASTSRQLDSDHKKAWLRRQHMEHEQSLARRRSVDLDAAPSIVAAFPAANASMRPRDAPVSCRKSFIEDAVSIEAVYPVLGAGRRQAWPPVDPTPSLAQRVLVQKRVAWKETYPSHFDPCPGGVMSPTETFEENAERELAEESARPQERRHVAQQMWG